MHAMLPLLLVAVLHARVVVVALPYINAGNGTLDLCPDSAAPLVRVLGNLTATGSLTTSNGAQVGEVKVESDGTMVIRPPQTTKRVRIDGDVNATVNGVDVAALQQLVLALQANQASLQTRAGAKLWTQQLGSLLGETCYDVAIDSAGNVFIAGITNGNLDGNTNAGSDDAFLVKFDSNGTKLWTRMLATSGEDQAFGVAIDSAGNVYVAGHTYGNLANVSNTGSADAFVTKFAANGTRIWTRLLGSTAYDESFGIAIDKPTNSVYITGRTDGGLNGSSSAGSADAFVAKLDSDGSIKWIRQVGGPNNDFGQGIAIDSAGNVCIVGYAGGTFDGNGHAGGDDIFVAKFASNGTKMWTRLLGTSARDVGKDIATDKVNNMYVTGFTQGSLDGNSNSGQFDAFVTKYDSGGAKQWTRQLGSNGDDFGYGITIDISNLVCVVGSAGGSLDGNSYGGGSADAFVTKFDNNGFKLSSRQFGTIALDAARAVAFDSSNNMHVAGDTYGSMDDLTNAIIVGGNDAFVIKYAG